VTVWQPWGRAWVVVERVQRGRMVRHVGGLAAAPQQVGLDLAVVQLAQEAERAVLQRPARRLRPRRVPSTRALEHAHAWRCRAPTDTTRAHRGCLHTLQRCSVAACLGPRRPSTAACQRRTHAQHCHGCCQLVSTRGQLPPEGPAGITGSLIARQHGASSVYACQCCAHTRHMPAVCNTGRTDAASGE